MLVDSSTQYLGQDLRIVVVSGDLGAGPELRVLYDFLLLSFYNSQFGTCPQILLLVETVFFDDVTVILRNPK